MPTGKMEVMSKSLVIYIAAAIGGAIMGWGFAGQFQEAFNQPPSEHPAIWMLAFGLGSPASLWLFMRDVIR